MNDWEILDLYFKDHKYPFTNHHLDSFRELIKTYIPQTIKSYNPITMIKFNENNKKIKMKTDIYIGGKNSDEIFIDHPITYEDGVQKIITPNDARLKSITYETHLYANVLIEITNEDDEIFRQVIEKVAIGSIPIMLHSDICVLNGNGNKVLQRLGECIYDGGGYFIIDGKEKIIIAQESETNNCLIIGKLKDDDNFSYKGKIKCSGEIGETILIPKMIEFYLVKTDEEVTEKYSNNKGCIYISLPSIEGKIPLFILFRALGIESDKDIYENIFGINNNSVEEIFFQNFIRPSIYNNYYEKDGIKYYIYTQEDALNYLKFRTKYQSIDHIRYIFAADIFPNINLFENKGKYLGYLTKQFFNVIYKIRKESDRDNYFYKRINISGFLLAELFQEAYMKLRKTIRDTMDNFYYFGAWKNTNNFSNFINKDNIYRLIPVVLIANTFAKSLKGRWGLESDDDPELGRVQDLSRISYIGYLSHLRRVNMPIDRSLKITSPHKLHSHQYGIMCPFESPDGASIGYLKNLALLAKVTAGTNPQNIRDCLLDIGVIPIENYNLKLDRNITKVLINNNWYGITNEPIRIMRILKAYKRNALINILTSISWNTFDNEINIFVDAGRGVRPLIILKNGKSGLTREYKSWFDMIIGKHNKYGKKERSEEIYYKNEYTNPKSLEIFAKKTDEEILNILEEDGAIIEYIDPQETDTSYIAMTNMDINNFHTHLEIHPSTMLSVVSANIPMCNHNQSARNVFHAAQTKQAIGIYATNFNKRFDTFGFIQHYPQKAIINTRHAQYTGSDAMPNGANLIVAIMTYSGFNQEDSLIINRKSIQRGLFHLSYYKSLSASEKKVSQYERMIFANPIKMREEGYKINGIKHANYTLLDENGVVKEGSYIPKGQIAVVLGMILIKDVLKEVKRGLFVEQVKETTYTDVSLTSDESYYGKIDKVFIGSKTLDDDIRVCKIRFMKIKIPEFGDKHSSRHGQKGVIGMILDEEQMPFTKDGIKPDLIVNPHAIPSRMTIGHLVECVYSKLCCMEGFLGDGSVFINLDYEKIYDNLEKLKFEKYGNEILYNGYNGKQINSSIFIGPTYYFRLKHMVAEKINARGTGPKVQLTRQPTGGRRKAGGLRIGEMERDSLISHGISKFIKESLMERSDNYRWIVCDKCGTAPIYSNKVKESFCKNCGGTSTSIIETPYCFKLLTQEFEAMGIQMRFNCNYTNLQVEEDYSDDDIIINEDIDEDEPKDIKVELKFKDKFANVSIKELIAKIKVKYPTMKGLTLKKRPELIAILEGIFNKEEEVKDEVKKEVKKNINDKSTKKDILDAVKNKYPEMKGVEKMKKEDLLNLLNKDNIEKVEVKKIVKKDTRTINQLKEELKNKYPNFKIKTTMKKDDLIKILEMTEEEFEKIKKGGYDDFSSSGDLTDTSLTESGSDSESGSENSDSDSKNSDSKNSDSEDSDGEDNSDGGTDDGDGDGIGGGGDNLIDIKTNEMDNKVFNDEIKVIKI